MSTSATPAMRQYLDAKQQHRDAILFFRMGDFYEMFYEDALVAARSLELTLTSRSKDASGGGIPMCGVPFHAADTYIARLVKKGFRVAICDQVEDPKKAKGIVKREVVRVVSPGTFTDSSYLDAREPAFLMAVTRHDVRDRATFGVALLDVSTGEFTATEYVGADGVQAFADELMVLRPREVLVASDQHGLDVAATQQALATAWPQLADAGLPMTPVDAWAFDPEAARRALLDQLRAGGLEGFGLDQKPAAVCAAGALVHYLRSTQKADLAHVRAIAYRQRADALLIESDDAEASRDRAGVRWRSRGIAARGAGSDGDVDGEPAAPLLAAASAPGARSDSRSARRRRRPGLPHDRAWQVPRCGERGPGSRAARGPGRARYRRPARPGRSQAVDRVDSSPPHVARRSAGAAGALARVRAGRSRGRARSDRVRARRRSAGPRP
ncbi:MAG: hypothetical protein QM736_07840 [Vicinamibacterales bacterium]